MFQLSIPICSAQIRATIMEIMQKRTLQLYMPFMQSFRKSLKDRKTVLLFHLNLFTCPQMTLSSDFGLKKHIKEYQMFINIFLKKHIQKNLHGSNPDGSFTLPD